MIKPVAGKQCDHHIGALELLRMRNRQMYRPGVWRLALPPDPWPRRDVKVVHTLSFLEARYDIEFAICAEEDAALDYRPTHCRPDSLHIGRMYDRPVPNF